MANPVVNGFELELINNKTEYSAVAYKESDSEAVIPAEYDGKPITKIGYALFANNKVITSITIPSSVNYIAQSAFHNCTSLVKVNFLGTIDEWAQITFIEAYANPIRSPKSLYINNELITKVKLTTATKISNYAFYYCESITSVEMPDSVKSIGDFAFRFCKALTSVEISDSVKTVGQYAFHNCTSLESVKLPNSLTSLEPHLFESCNALKTIEIPKTVTNIADRVFNSCTSLTSITIPNSVMRIGDSAFRGCSSLRSVIFESNSKLKSIIDYAFYACSSLKSITIPNSVTSLGSGVFYNCKSLTSAIIGDSVTYIGEWAFRFTNLQQVIMLNSTPAQLGGNAFKDVLTPFKIYCLKSSLEAYISAYNWKTYANNFVVDNLRLYFVMNSNAQKDYFVSKEELTSAIDEIKDNAASKMYLHMVSIDYYDFDREELRKLLFNIRLPKTSSEVREYLSTDDGNRILHGTLAIDERADRSNGRDSRAVIITHFMNTNVYMSDVHFEVVGHDPMTTEIVKGDLIVYNTVEL